MQESIEKAGVLIEALPYIKSFHHKVVVVKLGGSVMADSDCLRSVLTDIVWMEQVGMWPIVVHGGGKRISEEMERAGITPRFVDGRRVTSADVIELVQRVAIDEISTRVCTVIQEAGGKAIALNGRHAPPFILARKITPGGEDIGFVGEVTAVDSETARRLCDGGIIPVVAPIGRGEDGCLYNINGDTAASGIARLMKAEKLVFLSDVPGILEDLEKEDSLLSTLTRDEVVGLVKSGAISGGMLPKVDACLDVIEGGVRKTHIIGTMYEHALLLEMFTRKGIGTEIVP